MIPNAFLKTLWQAEMRPQIFLAMSDDKRYQRRFDLVLSPAVADIHTPGGPYSVVRSNFTKSGDACLSELIDGIAHSRLFLADVSVVGCDASGTPIRNSYVLHALGMALACRQADEILIVRDDHERFFLDGSEVPQLQLDFINESAARDHLRIKLEERLRQQDFLADARVRNILASLTYSEVQIIKLCGQYDPSVAWGVKEDGGINLLALQAIPRLLDKQVIQLGSIGAPSSTYRWTPLGHAVVQAVKRQLAAAEPAKK